MRSPKMVLVTASLLIAGVPLTGHAQAFSEDEGPRNTIRLDLRAGPNGSPIADASVGFITDLGSSDEILWGVLGSHTDLRLLVDHVAPGGGRVAISGVVPDLSLEVVQQDGQLQWSLGYKGSLRPLERLSLVLTAPSRAILSADVPQVADGSVAATVELLTGGQMIRATDHDAGVGVVLGPIAAGTGSRTVSSGTSLIGSPAWVDCVGFCDYWRRSPGGTRVHTWAHGDPVNGHGAVTEGEFAAFIGPPGPWTFEWEGSFLRTTVMYEISRRQIALSEPVVFILMRADGLETPDRAW